MSILSGVEKPISKARQIFLGEQKAKRGILPTIVSGVGFDLTAKMIDNTFGSPVQRIASFNIPFIGPIGPIDVINFFIHGGPRNLRGGFTAIIGAKAITGTLSNIGPFRLPGASPGSQPSATLTGLANQGAPI